MIPVGTLDRITVIVGERGMGKSTFLSKVDIPDFRRETGGYVIGHSTNGQIGADPGRIEFHDDLRQLSRGLRKHPERAHFVARGKPEDVLRYGLAMSLSVRKRAHERFRAERFRIASEMVPKFRPDRPAPKGLLAPPVLVVIDEGMAMRRNPTQAELQELEELLTSARHNHVAVTWSSQSPSLRQWVLLEQSNRQRVFRYVHEYGANALRAGGVHKDVIPALRELPRFTYYRFDKIDPHGAGFAPLPPP